MGGFNLTADQTRFKDIDAQNDFGQSVGASLQSGIAGSLFGPQGLGLVKDPITEFKQQQIQRQAEEQLQQRQASDTQRDAFRMQTLQGLMNQDPTTSLGFQRALGQSRNAISQSLGASGLGDSPFGAALQGQAAGSLAADFEQQRMNQIFQALGLNIQELGMSSDQITNLLAQFGNDPNMLLEWAKVIAGAIPG